MQKIDGPGHDNNEFTEGNAGTGEPATVVTSKFMNSIQKELANVVTKAGLSLVPPGVEESDPEFKTDQLAEAISKVAKTSSDIVDILNNQSVKVSFGGLGTEEITLNKTLVRSAIFEYEIYRKDAVNEIKVIGRSSFAYKPIADTFAILGGFEDQDPSEEDHGVEFYLENIGGDIFALRYKSSNLAGGSYLGKLSYSLKSFLN